MWCWLYRNTRRRDAGGGMFAGSSGGGATSRASSSSPSSLIATNDGAMRASAAADCGDGGAKKDVSLNFFWRQFYFFTGECAFFTHPQFQYLIASPFD